VATVAEAREERILAGSPEAEDARGPSGGPLPDRVGRTVLVAGTFDTKGRELGFVADRLRSLGMAVRTVDLSTSGAASGADVPAQAVASLHPHGTAAVISGDRGRAVTAMADAFARWIGREPGIGGIL